MEISKKFLATLRFQPKKGKLDEKMVSKNPFQQFRKWFAIAAKKNISEPNAMVLSTAGKNGKPSSRVVLLKDINDKGFVFFTNYGSRKGKYLIENPYASLTFFWKELSQQIHVEGRVRKISPKESDEYFNTRPFGSKVGATISPQSEVIPDRKFLENKMISFTNNLKDENIPRPKIWGGFIIIPERIEFWKGRESRLHDRILYTRQKNSRWKIQRLAP